jgi:acetyl-CoA carboxylase biotin carboxyl carrier protein
MNLKDIKGIVDLMKKNAISEFEMEEADFKIKLKRDSGKTHGSGTLVAQEAVPVMLPVSNAPIPASPAPGVGAAMEPAQEGPEVKSPMIGTFYRKPSPEADSYVDVGSMVEPDTVVCLIEAMKVMNEIKAEVKGTIAEVLAEDGKPVEYGQSLFRIEPN